MSLSSVIVAANAQFLRGLKLGPRLNVPAGDGQDEDDQRAQR